MEIILRVLILGMGVQGQKRKVIANNHVVGTVDPYNKDANYQNYKDVPISSFDSAIISTPDTVKLELIEYFLNNKKHILVEKPLFSNSSNKLKELLQKAKKNNLLCYTAYNHRFEPHFISMKNLIESKELGDIYTIRLFYGNGTAKLVWRY